nr:ParB/RepB/Spo0J family partition protein [Arthrobacter jiangjiafuii]
MGRGLGALIPSSADVEEAPAAPARAGRPVDLFFPSASDVVTPTRPGTGPRRGAGINKDALRGPAAKAPKGAAARARQQEAALDTAGAAVDAAEAKPASAVEPASKSAKSAAHSPDHAAEGSATTKAARAPKGRQASAKQGGMVKDSKVKDSRPAAALVADGEAGGVSSAREDTDVSRETLVPVPGATFAELPIDSIHPNRKQPRSVFDEDDMAELVHSIREIGVLQPIVVRPSPEDDPEHPYELVMGERRWRASREAGLDAVPAIIRSTQDVDLLRDALLENLHRSELNPLEEAAAYQQLLDDFGCSHEELADRIGRSRPQVTNTLRLMKLPPLVQRRLAAGILSAGHSRALLRLADAAEMEKLAQRIVAEGLSVRATEEIVSLSGGLRRPPKESKPKVGARHERLDYLATSLSDRLDTNVKITLGARKGKVSIEFASVDDLNRIMGVLTPPAS